MFCPHCGGPVEDGAAFCTYCGQPIGPAQPQTPPPTPQAALRQEAQPAPQPPQNDAKPAKSGTGLGVKLTALALAGTAAFFGGKALLDELGGGPPADTRPPYTQSARPSGEPSDPGGKVTDPATPPTDPATPPTNPVTPPTDPATPPTDPGGSPGRDPGVYYDPDTGRFQGESGVAQHTVTEGPAAGMTVEAAAAEDIFFLWQDFSYASAKEDPGSSSELFILRLDPEAGVAYLMDEPDNYEDAIVYDYDPDSGTISMSLEDGDEYARIELIRNPDGSWSGSAHGYTDGDEMNGYIELNRVTPTADGAWMTLETGERFTDDERTYLLDTRIGSEFLSRAAEYAAANGYSMEAREPDSQSQSWQPGPKLTAPVELTPELIDYYVMVEGQNRLRNKARKEEGDTTTPPSSIHLPKTNSITEAEFEARVEEYVRRWGPNPG